MRAQGAARGPQLGCIESAARLTESAGMLLTRPGSPAASRLQGQVVVQDNKKIRTREAIENLIFGVRDEPSCPAMSWSVRPRARPFQLSRRAAGFSKVRPSRRCTDSYLIVVQDNKQIRPSHRCTDKPSCPAASMIDKGRGGRFVLEVSHRISSIANRWRRAGAAGLGNCAELSAHLPPAPPEARRRPG